MTHWFQSEYRRGLAAVFLTCLLWGVLALILKYVNQWVSTGTIVWLRFLIAAAVQLLWISYWDPDLIKPLRRPPLLLPLAGLGLALNYFGFMRGLELTTPIHAQILIQIGPLMLAVVGIFMFRERPRWYQWGGVGLAIAGFTLFYASKKALSGHRLLQLNQGSLWILMAGLAWTLYSVFVKLLGRRLSPLTINLFVYTLAVIVLFPWVHLAELRSLGLVPWVLIVFLGFNTVLAYGALAYALARVPAHQISLIITMNPIITMFLTQLAPWVAWTWIQPDPLGVQGAWGAIIVVAGVVLAVRRK